MYINIGQKGHINFGKF